MTDNFDFNVAFLAEQALQASGGFFTTVVTGSGLHASLVRVDGKPLGFHEGIGGEMHPITGMGVDVFVPRYGRLSRRNRSTLKDIVNAIRTVLYAKDPFGSYSLVRSDIGKVAWDAGDRDTDTPFRRYLLAGSSYESRNRLDAVKDRGGAR
jgi:hypothetical protein